MRKEKLLKEKIFWKPWFAWYPVSVSNRKENKETLVWLEKIWKCKFDVFDVEHFASVRQKMCYWPFSSLYVTYYSIEKPNNLELTFDCFVQEEV